MLIIPAVDIKGGRCVRLVEGRPERETVYADDPAAMARRWEEMGARFLHLVDLDGAFQGRPVNTETVKAILNTVSIPVELGGGIRTLATAEEWLSLGVRRVIFGTAALTNPDLVEEACRRFGPERVVLGLDARDGKVAVEGWGKVASRAAVDLALEMKERGIIRVIYTDISRDGTHRGPNIEATRELARRTGLKVIASGGVSTLEHILAVKELEPDGVEGVITGKALYDGTLDLREALAAVAGQDGGKGRC